MNFGGPYGGLDGAPNETGSAGGSGLNVTDAEAAMSQLQAQIQAETMQELVQEITGKCFEKCVSRPSPSLSGGEQTCLARCYDRYMECMTVVYSSLAKQAQASGSSQQ